MKKLLIILFLPLIFKSQTEEKLSNVEKFSEQAGSLLEKTFLKIGSVKTLEVVVLKVKDINTGKGFSALRFEYELPYTKDQKINAVDQDEVDALTKSMNAMFAIFNTTKENYTEVVFKSRSGFKIGSYYSSEKTAPISSSKNEKVYVETKEAMFEGKVVNKDDKGTFIWKTVTPKQEVNGKWVIYAEWEVYGVNPTMALSSEEFKSLLSIIEQAKTKM
jgi:hypothetical protein